MDKNQVQLCKWLIHQLPTIILTGFIIVTRLFGLLERWELSNFDWLLRSRPPETTDQRIVIIGINEQYIQTIEQYPISDEKIAHILKTIQKYDPKAIGLDLVRDISVQPGHELLIQVLQNSDNIIGMEKVLPPIIAPPPLLPARQIGFSDAIADNDGRFRRNLLGTYVDEKKSDYRFSFALRLAEIYLQDEGFSLENGIKDKQTMRFGETELPRFSDNFGGYFQQNSGGVQVLLNYRHGKQNFPIFSVQQLIQGEIEPKLLQNRIVLIGMMASSVSDSVSTNAVSSSHVQGEIYGVEFQAHAISQIISATLDKRPLIKSLPEGLEYLWIIAWGIVGVFLSRLTISPLKNLLMIIFANIILVGICYGFLWWGWWLPLIPTVLILVSNGTIMTSFYLAEQNLLLQLKERQRTIEETFTTIHNGPLQTLAVILQNLRKNDDDNSSIQSQLETLNLQIRGIGEYLQQEALNPSESLRLGSGLILDLKHPVNDLFYQTYSSTINRPLPCFQTLKIKVRSFAPISMLLNLEQKQKLCQFLEEALCNIGKHAQGVVRIDAIGKEKDGYYYLTIKDNGKGKTSVKENSGTKQGKRLAQELRGTFKRETLQPKGFLCELRFPTNSSHYRWWNK